MSERNLLPGDGNQSSPRSARRPLLLYVLVGLLAAECAMMAAITGLLLYDLLAETPDSYISAVAIVVLAALAAGWLVVLAIHTLAGRSWVRGAAVFWQILQIAIGVGSTQGMFPRADIGWFLILPAVVVLVLLFTPQVIQATTAHDD